MFCWWYLFLYNVLVINQIMLNFIILNIENFINISYINVFMYCNGLALVVAVSTGLAHLVRGKLV